MSEGLFRKPGNKDKPTVFLTFDDGPIPEVTPWVLDMLDRFGAKATFFMVGDNVRKYPEIFQQVIKRGHAVGNHTMHHLNGIKVNSEQFIRDTDEASRIIKSTLFRPPHGWMRRRQVKTLASRYHIVMYDVVTRDYSKWLKAEDITDNVKRLTRDGSVIVFHDSVKSFERLEHSLPQCLEWLKNQGYYFGILDPNQQK